MLHGYTDSSVSYSRVLPLIDAKLPRFRVRPAPNAAIFLIGKILRTVIYLENSQEFTGCAVLIF